jgi:transposase
VSKWRDDSSGFTLFRIAVSVGVESDFVAGDSIMLTFPATTKVFVCTKPTDMRKSFDSLMGLVQSFLNEDPLSGHLFVFVSKRCDRVKILWWDRDGLVLWYKRLEKGTFRFGMSESGRLEITSVDLQLILQGIDPAKVVRQKRYQLAANASSPCAMKV